MSAPEASAALRKEHADQQVSTGGKGRGKTSLPGLAWDAPWSPPQLPARREARLAQTPTVTTMTATGRCAKPGASCASSC